jgi:hypothetical protein
MTQGAFPLDIHEAGELVTYTMVLPFLPPSKNVYEDWPAMWKSSAKGKWASHIARMRDELDIPMAQQIGLAAVLVFPGPAHRDPQNYAQALWHWVPDALVRCGVIPDDNEGRIEIGPNWGLKFEYDQRRRIHKDLRKRTRLAITMRVP